MQSIRRAVGNMPYRRRHEGMTALERLEVKEHWEVIFGLLTAMIGVAALENHPIMYDQMLAGGVVLVTGLITQVTSYIILVVYCTTRHLMPLSTR